MKASLSRSRLGTRGRPEESRKAILQAAIREFARDGIAGARTDAIARMAKVNKALLYYYFEDKDALYGAVLDEVFGGLSGTVHAALNQPLPPREKIMAYAGAHFDYIATHPLYPRIVQGEMMNAAAEGGSQLKRIVKQYLQPLFLRLSQVLEEGARSGEFRRVNPRQFVPVVISVIVFYFTTTPVMKIITGADPLAPEMIAERRAAVLDFISAALFRKQQALQGDQP